VVVPDGVKTTLTCAPPSKLTGEAGFVISTIVHFAPNWMTCSFVFGSTFWLNVEIALLVMEYVCTDVSTVPSALL